MECARLTSKTDTVIFEICFAFGAFIIFYCKLIMLATLFTRGIRSVRGVGD